MHRERNVFIPFSLSKAASGVKRYDMLKTKRTPQSFSTSKAASGVKRCDMGGSGPVPNRLPHDLRRKIMNGGNLSRRYYLFEITIRIPNIVKSRWRFLLNLGRMNPKP
jgi:hypothetical protein